MIDGINIRQDISVKVLQQQESIIYEEPNASPPFVCILGFHEFVVKALFEESKTTAWSLGKDEDCR